MQSGVYWRTSAVLLKGLGWLAEGSRGWGASRQHSPKSILPHNQGEACPEQGFLFLLAYHVFSTYDFLPFLKYSHPPSVLLKRRACPMSLQKLPTRSRPQAPTSLCRGQLLSSFRLSSLQLEADGSLLLFIPSLLLRSQGLTENQ